MNESKAGRKVRGHNAAVDFFEVAVASEKSGNVPSVPRFSQVFFIWDILPLIPRSFRIIALAQNSSQIRRSKGLMAKIRETKELRPYSWPGSPLSRSLDLLPLLGRS